MTKNKLISLFVMDGISIKDKLEAYRRQKRKAEMTESIKYAIHNILPWNGNKTATDSTVLLATNDLEVGSCYFMMCLIPVIV